MVMFAVGSSREVILNSQTESNYKIACIFKGSDLHFTGAVLGGGGPTGASAHVTPSMDPPVVPPTGSLHQ